MMGRFLLLLVGILLLTSAVSSVVSPRVDRNGTGAAALGAAARAPSSPAQAGDVRTVDAKLPRTGPIHARVGDIVNLTVSSEADDVVDVAGLGYTQPVSAGTPARLTVLPAQPGSFPVTLSYSGEQVGKLVVAP